MDSVIRSEPDIAITVPKMPPRIRADGVAFVEFAASDAEATSLGALLHSMGFRRVGRHVSKSVELWQQGDVRIILNTDGDGFANSSHVMHGMNICDIGLSVESAKDTLARADMLAAKTFHQAVGPGELDIPAIRGVGGGLLHFIDDVSGLRDVWDVEFRPVEDDTPSAACGLTRIDHIAQTMAYDELLTWSLFYISLFDLAKAPVIDVVDPGGLVRSQAIASADGKLRLTLNGAETHRTMAGRFVADSFGSSVQHVAFASKDIYETAKAMANVGFSALPIPNNYYDDLAARLGLDDEKVEELKALNILYDEDASGAFYQFYSKPFGDGMFFEIVQRTGGYSGYGAPNAPYRTAAQRRLMRPASVPAR
jgi:4-hydroxyphenylpyruvate dioxygenase